MKREIKGGRSTMEAFILGDRLHFAPSTKKMSKLVTIRYIKEQTGPSVKNSIHSTIKNWYLYVNMRYT